VKAHASGVGARAVAATYINAYHFADPATTDYWCTHWEFGKATDKLVDLTKQGHMIPVGQVTPLFQLGVSEANRNFFAIDRDDADVLDASALACNDDGVKELVREAHSATTFHTGVRVTSLRVIVHRRTKRTSIFCCTQTWNVILPFGWLTSVGEQRSEIQSMIIRSRWNAKCWISNECKQRLNM